MKITAAALFRALLLLAPVAVLLLSAPLRTAAAPLPSPSLHDHDMAASDGGEHQHPQGGEEIGVAEHTGEKIPLDLTFRDEFGQAVVLRELIDRPTLILPVYYHCPNVCNFLQASAARILPAVKLAPGEQFQVISISFDERETPEDARRAKKLYFDAMGGDFPPDAWRFLTGDLPAIETLMAAIGYRFERRGEDFIHPVASLVVAGDGRITRYFYGTSLLAMDVTLGLVEASEGRVGPAIRKMVEFCFSFDPASNRYVFNLFRVSATVILITAGAFLLFLILTGRRQRRLRGHDD